MGYVSGGEPVDEAVFPYALVAFILYVLGGLGCLAGYLFL